MTSKAIFKPKILALNFGLCRDFFNRRSSLLVYSPRHFCVRSMCQNIWVRIVAFHVRKGVIDISMMAFIGALYR